MISWHGPHAFPASKYTASGDPAPPFEAAMPVSVTYIDRGAAALQQGNNPSAGRHIAYWHPETIERGLPARFLGQFHEHWAPSRFSAQELNDPAATTVVVPLPVAQTGTRTYSVHDFHLMGQRTNFVLVLDAAASLARQNPHAAVRAFRTAFPGRADVEMVIVLQNPKAARGRLREFSDITEDDSRIWYWDTELSADATNGLITNADVLVSLHRANGFGVDIARAMSLNTLVIASRWGGNMDFTTDDNSLLVDVDPCSPESGGAGAAQNFREPDFAKAVSAFKSAAEAQDLRARLILEGSKINFTERFRSAVKQRLGCGPLVVSNAGIQAEGTKGC